MTLSEYLGQFAGDAAADCPHQRGDRLQLVARVLPLEGMAADDIGAALSTWRLREAEAARDAQRRRAEAARVETQTYTGVVARPEDAKRTHAGLDALLNDGWRVTHEQYLIAALPGAVTGLVYVARLERTQVPDTAGLDARVPDLRPVFTEMLRQGHAPGDCTRACTTGALHAAQLALTFEESLS